MTDRWSKLAPLTGVLFAVLAVVGVFSGGETPNANASPAKVIAYYTTHRSEVETSAILFALAFLVLVLFAGTLRSYLRRTPAAEGLGSLVLAGGVLMGVGALMGTGVEYGLAHQLHHLGPQVAQALNFLSNELFLPVLGGAFVFAICSGLAILRGAALPKWLGWVAIVLGIAALVPPASFPALLGFLIWSVIVSILMYQRTGASAETGAAVSQPVV
ncbi:MAG TPA: hypothetical protein VG053_05120 [Solirubrobacteraceae bacterium]|nr:hypothetical protein [Solirubrobacteraceae bacterium]